MSIIARGEESLRVKEVDKNARYIEIHAECCSMHELSNSQIAEGGEVETSHYFKTSGIICLSPYLLSFNDILKLFSLEKSVSD